MITGHTERLTRARAELIKARTEADNAGALDAGHRITLALCDIDRVLEDRLTAIHYDEPPAAGEETTPCRQ